MLFLPRSEGDLQNPDRARAKVGKSLPGAQKDVEIMTDDVKGERIAKFLARAGVGSRRDVERMVAEGRIIVNNEVIQQPATFVTAQDMIRVDGAVIGPQERTRVWRYHKPTGLVTTHHDPQNRKTVFESLPPGLPRVISIGRLDLNSKGCFY